MEGILKLLKSDDSDAWEVKTDGKELNIVKQHLSMSEHEKDRTILTATKLLGNCSNPYGVAKHKVGLAIGKVQSGKTSNYICMTALALDNDYKIVIIFGGTSKVLAKQTYDRVYDNFDMKDRMEDSDLCLLTTSNNLSQYSATDLQNLHRSGKKIIITALKSYTHIKKVTSILKKAGLDKIPTLIIDDEGDQASLNGAVKKNKTTTTYREFLNLFDGLAFSTFMSVTATPQANFLIDDADKLSPDFCELLTPGDSYCGGEVFHNEKFTKYISEIPINENIMVDENVGIPESFERALSTFFVGGVIRKFRGDNSVHSMLIHPSVKLVDHSEVESKVNSVLKKYSNCCLSPEEDQQKSFYNFIELGFKELDKTIKESFDLDEIVDELKKDFFNRKVIVLNGDNDTQEIKYVDFKYFIIIGGSMVERGLTVKNLACTYIVRTSKGKENADTVSQRCRWYGYKESKGMSYLDVCRVFMTDEMAEGFYKLKLGEDSMWETVKVGIKEGIPLKEMPRLFELDPHFNPTRKNVTSYIEELKFGKFSTQRCIKNMHNPDIIYNEFMELLNNYKKENLYGNNVMYKDVDYNALYEIINKYYKDEDLKFNYKYMLAAKMMLERKEKPLVLNVIVMRENVGEERTVYDDFTVSNIMQGENSTLGMDNYYPGDDSLYPGIQLQIHRVKPKKNPLVEGKVYPVLAFYAPNVAGRLVGRF